MCEFLDDMEKSLSTLNFLQHAIIVACFDASKSVLSVLQLLFLRFALPFLSHPSHCIDRDLMKRVIGALCCMCSDRELDEHSPKLEALVNRYRRPGPSLDILMKIATTGPAHGVVLVKQHENPDIRVVAILREYLNLKS